MNLTDCTLSACDFTGASFNKTILVHTEFSTLELTAAKSTDAKLIDVKLTLIDLRKTSFENCIFIGVKFGRAALIEVTFKGATPENVSFAPPFSLSKKYSCHQDH